MIPRTNRSRHAYYGKHRTRGGRTAAKIGERAGDMTEIFIKLEYEQRKGNGAVNQYRDGVHQYLPKYNQHTKECQI